MIWSDIPGWFDFADLYDRTVASAQDGAHFVEVGVFLGRSLCYLADKIAESGKTIRLDAVDSFRGAGTDGNSPKIMEVVAENGGDFKAAFENNMKECGHSDRVNVIESDSAQAADRYENNSLDFVFIDADHSAEGCGRDLKAWWPKIKPGAVMAGHDYDEPGVAEAVKNFSRTYRLCVSRDNRCWIMWKYATKPHRTLIGVPSGSASMHGATALAAFAFPCADRTGVDFYFQQSSLLAHGFNQLWIRALESGYTHFAMCHSDMVPAWYWLDLMHAEMDRSGSDLLGCVSPLKDSRGLTSIGIGMNDGKTWWTPKKRLSMQEVCRLPMTFGAEDAGYPGHALLLNTGLWLADLRNPLWRVKDERNFLRACFTIRDRITEHEGKLLCGVQSEDWFFSARCHELGIKAKCTRLVDILHMGEFGFPNSVPWGMWADDQTTAHLWRESCTA